MPRVGRHPLKQQGLKDDVKHREITVATIVHIPGLVGYWEQSLEVLKLFFESLFASTDLPFDLMVFDNNSCVEVQDYLLTLQREGKIQYLTLATYNLRKLGALNYLLSVAPGNYVAFADSDVYFLPGWLDSSIEILNAFPNAGKVTALPIVGGDTSQLSSRVFREAVQHPNISVESGIIVADQFIESHRRSIGLSYDTYQQRLIDRKDVLLSCNGCQALLSTADFQFTIKRSAIQAALPLVVDSEDEYFDPIYSPVLERRLDEAGYWQLSTPGYYVHHLGNSAASFESEIPWYKGQLLHNSATQRASSNKPSTPAKRLLSHRMARKLLHAIHLWSYRALYES